VVGDGTLYWASGLGVVGDGAFYGAGLEVFDVFPADGFSVCFFAGKADAGETFGAGEDYAAFLVVPGVGFVLAHDRELDTVDGFQFFLGEAKGHGGEDIYFHQGLAAGVVGAQGVVAVPGWGEVGEKGVGEAGVVFGPVVVFEIVMPAFLPEFGVVGCEAGYR